MNKLSVWPTAFLKATMIFGTLLSFVMLSTPSTAQDKTITALKAEVEENLRTHILKPWFPVSIDTVNGGFTESYDNDWRPNGNSKTRSIVYQSRLTWVASAAMDLHGADKAMFAGVVKHGIESLKNLMWDGQSGGFYWQIQLNNNGKWNPIGTEKHAYGISFGIYASAAAYGATRAPEALKMAMDCFHWLDKNAHDNVNGGYYEALSRSGKPILSRSGNARDNIGTPYGYKSMNTHIHLLEAFSELYRVNPDQLVRLRLLELFKIVRDKIYVGPGCLQLYFNPNWRPVPDGDSFGHDIETAYLLVEAAETLRIPHDPVTWKAARNLVDHALSVGWDDKYGGFYDLGTAFGPATKLEKVWWTQAEGLNALLLMHTLYGMNTNKYWDAFQKQWEFIQRYQIDKEHGGWYTTVSPELKPMTEQNKSDQWKDPYHQGRALMNVLKMLNKLKTINN